MKNKKQLLKVKNEQRLMQFLHKQKSPVYLSSREIASQVKLYNPKRELVHPSNQGVMDVIKRLEPIFLMRDMTGYKMKIIINR